jgi:hypothetical protein
MNRCRRDYKFSIWEPVKDNFKPVEKVGAQEKSSRRARELSNQERKLDCGTLLRAYGVNHSRCPVMIGGLAR